MTSERRRRAGIAASMVTACCALVAGQPRPATVACLPDRPAVFPGDIIDVHAWVSAADGTTITGRVTVAWQVETGEIDRNADSARWRLSGGVVDRRYLATARVQLDGTPLGSCSFGVWVVSPIGDGAVPSPTRRGEFIARRAFLRKGDPGEAGYGLYSYFLMRPPGDERARTRQAAVVRALIDLMSPVAEQENYIERSRLNRAYLPVTMAAPADLATPLPEWLLGHYDHERALALLSLYPTLTGEGPFVIAVPRPLRGPVTPLLTWDLSGLEDRELAAGVGRFLNQSAQLYEWNRPSALEELRDRLLISVAGMFVGRAAAETWIQVAR